MQMTIESTQRPGLMLAFASRRSKGYMMRSEKRPGSAGSGRNGKGRPPRRKKAGAFYILLTLLVSVILWPVGMVMLWRRKVYMQAGTKLLLSMLTLCMCIFLIVFGLTVPVDNPQFTAFQDKANDWLDKAQGDVAVAADAAWQKAGETWGVMTNLAGAGTRYGVSKAADGLEESVKLVGRTKDRVVAMINGTELPPESEPTATPEASATPEATGTVEATGKPSERPTADGTGLFLPALTPEPESAQPLGEGTLHPDGSFTPAESALEESPETAQTAPETSPEAEASAAEESAQPEASAQPEESAEAVQTAEPTATPEPTPTAEPVITVNVKPAAEATVYYYDISQLYHMAPECRGMSSAPAHTLKEAVEAGKRRCGTCGTPDSEILDEPMVAWLDANGVFHTTDECASFKGQWKLISLSKALEEGDTPCPDCQADIYAGQSHLSEDRVTVVTPAHALKSAGQATVYHSSNGRFYHAGPVCTNMTGASAYTLEECADGYTQCSTCNPPSLDLLGQPCLWQDDTGLCHTTDACEKFSGSYTLVVRDDALFQGLDGCPVCGADEYLVPGTTLAE